MYEVELKFRLEHFQDVESRIRQLGAQEQPAVSQVDRYFNHPSRDFRSTDEAFRIRSVNETNCITYKGAVIGDVAKTRHEIEVELSDGAEALKKLIEIVGLLGFRFIREVRKSRRPFALCWNGRDYELVLDDVPLLGKFVEIELFSDDDDRTDTEAAVWRLATELGLTIAEPRSYLDLLLKLEP